MIEDLAEVDDPDIALAHRDEIELIGEEAPHQSGAGALDVFRWRLRLARREVEELVDLVA